MAVSAAAQPTVVSSDPPLPTGSTPVTLVLFNACGCPIYDDHNVTRNGFTIDVPRSSGCFSACFPAENRIPLGVLAPGTYTVRQVRVDDPADVQVIGTFVVAAATPAIPAIGPTATIVLALTLTLLALVALRR